MHYVHQQSEPLRSSECDSGVAGVADSHIPCDVQRRHRRFLGTAAAADNLAASAAVVAALCPRKSHVADHACADGRVIDPMVRDPTTNIREPEHKDATGRISDVDLE